jgi:Family of unknown function (DUF716)
VGFILYKPLPGSKPWDQEDHDQIMVITLMFAWHIAAVLTVMIAIGACVHMMCYRRVSVTSHQRRDAENIGCREQLQLLSVKLPASATSAGSDSCINEDDELETS